MIEFKDIENENLDENRELENSNVEELKNLDTIDLLLASDMSKFKKPSKQIEIPRLSEIIGKPFIIELRLLNSTLTEKIEKKYLKLLFDEDGNPDIDNDTEGQIAETLVEACYTLDGKQIFKNAQLRNKFNVKSNNDLVKKFLLAGERKKIYDRYKELAGYIKTSVNDIKN